MNKSAVPLQTFRARPFISGLTSMLENNVARFTYAMKGKYKRSKNFVGTQTTRWHCRSLFFVEHPLTFFLKCHAGY